MKKKLIDLVLNHIDAATDTDELKDFGEFIDWMIKHEDAGEKNTNKFLLTLHKDLLEIYHSEFDFIRKIRLRTAIVNFELRFAAELCDEETKTLDKN
jgi:hypothetical protein